MTLSRPPLSLDAALARIAGQLPGDWERMAALTGYQKRTVQKWGAFDVASDEGEARDIPMRAAIVLDIEYRRAGGAGRPIYDAYGYLLGVDEEERFADAFDILRHAVDVVREVGQAKAALLEAALPDATDADRRDAQREIIEAIEAMKAALLNLERQTPPRLVAPP
ncbi:hypothetical protein [Sphingobium scionense]|jgi:hypothetical protein|uniref:Uncharacterized protein n=1 Tax=Sphingobium scionense TaxID=1404341 RepID=A0A7W6PXL7_9SPHN|nr:hypothetical protein [Sphingobium scionense]MBB4149100.1 hypothetical protein [Sphingobium scionense]